MKLGFKSLIVAPVSVSRDMIVLYLCAQWAVLYSYNCLPEGMIILYLFAQLAVLYSYNCLPEVMIILYLCAQLAVLYTYNCLPGGRIVLYLCAQLAVLYTYNCLLRMICYRLGQNQLLINKKAVLSRYSLWPTKLVMDYRISSLYTL